MLQPFLVEAAVSIGGEGHDGLQVYRFANRIPLLFETGADVATQVATKKIAWGNYHIDLKRDNVGVYVSIVSTKVGRSLLLYILIEGLVTKTLFYCRSHLRAPQRNISAKML